MASLIEELLSVMDGEKKNYDSILEMSDSKREAIINGDIDSLESITSREEDIADDLASLENRRRRILGDMAVVLGRDGEDITVSELIDLLDGQPEEQKSLGVARDALMHSASQVRFWNDQNQILLKQSLEMVNFDITLMKSMRQAPETANYNSKAFNTGDLLGTSGFDAKQ